LNGRRENDSDLQEIVLIVYKKRSVIAHVLTDYVLK